MVSSERGGRQVRQLDATTPIEVGGEMKLQFS